MANGTFEPNLSDRESLAARHCVCVLSSLNDLGRDAFRNLKRQMMEEEPFCEWKAVA